MHCQEASSPLLKEDQGSSLRPAAEPYMPRHTMRAAKRTAWMGASKAMSAKNVILRTLGLVADDLAVDNQVVEELKGLFNSPLREQHIMVIAALFGKSMPIGGDLARQDSVLVGAQ